MYPVHGNQEFRERLYDSFLKEATDRERRGVDDRVVRELDAHLKTLTPPLKGTMPLTTNGVTTGTKLYRVYNLGNTPHGISPSDTICNAGETYSTEKEAIEMAECRALQNPGGEYLVLKAISSSRKPMPQAITVRY
jgi:hypothetical protein